MFSIIGMINGYLGYINMNVRLKNQVYTVLGSVGDCYLLYVAYRFFANGFWLRGLLFVLAFLGLGYLAYLNLIYYFTKKNSKLDFTPWLEKTLHLKPRPVPTEGTRRPQPGFVQTNGLFTNEKVLPAEISSSLQQQQTLQQIVEQLVAQNYLKLDYAGMSDDQILRNGQTVSALNQPVALPYYELQHQGEQLFLAGGINQMEKKVLGQIKTVGLMPVAAASQRYQLYAATVTVQGGPVKFAGRSSVMVEQRPYTVKLQLAYRPKTENKEIKQNRQNKH